MNLKNNIGLSVVIPCYNSAWVIKETLEYLSKQREITKDALEILLIDNNSTDNTSQIAFDYWEMIGSPFDLRIFSETKQGLTPTREKGIKESRFNYVLFCDDDNFLCDNYCSVILNVFKNNSNVGLIGGLGIEKLNGNFDKRIVPFLKNYAIGPQAEQSGILPKGKYLYGAGLALNKAHLDIITKRGFTFSISDRTGKSLSSGGDTEICYLYMINGFDLYYESEIFFYHNLREDRLTWEYLIKLIKALSISSVHLRKYSYFYESYFSKNKRVQKLIWLKSIFSLIKEKRKLQKNINLAKDQKITSQYSINVQIKEYLLLKGKLDNAVKKVYTQIKNIN